ncbi:MAG: hypothetical protein LC667_05535 [Thioalkalivibrio sp.]|nr:hypothetical protein [Thioalkalivibrio sp.]
MGQTLLGWHEDPEKAVQFSEFEDAEPVAQQILANMTDPQNEQYRIVICAVFDRGSQLLVKSVEEPFVIELPPMSPEAEAALPAFLEILRDATDEEWSQDVLEQRAGRPRRRAPTECAAARRSSRMRGSGSHA